MFNTVLKMGGLTLPSFNTDHKATLIKKNNSKVLPKEETDKSVEQNSTEIDPHEYSR